ncbi:MAG: ATP-binding protein [Kiritimatiellae bacterium]|nr:ATP-binding protein [Kiritimatiellia bacterium]
MAFLSGPRQVGKTTIARSLGDVYLDWDSDDARTAIVAGQRAVADLARLDSAATAGTSPLVVFDEIHRYGRWKTFLKGFFDVYSPKARILATGSARMDVFKRGGDSLMGRYFPYRMHPFSVAELLSPALPPASLLRPPSPLPPDDWKAFLAFGGFPEPFSRRTPRFSSRWNRLRDEQLLRDDIRDLSRIAEISQLAVLARILLQRSGTQLLWSALAADTKTDEKTAKRWVAALSSLYFGFTVTPWFRNVANSLRKTPKWYLRDWARVADSGQRFETFVACHLLKAVETWTDLGYGDFSLHYLRDKQKREVDFLVARDGSPWFLVEAKVSDGRISPALAHFQRATSAPYAFQVVLDAPFRPFDAFAAPSSPPVALPALAFLSQLV